MKIHREEYSKQNHELKCLNTLYLGLFNVPFNKDFQNHKKTGEKLINEILKLKLIKLSFVKHDEK